MKIEKCNKINGKMIYCDNMRAVVINYEKLPVDPKKHGVTVDLGNEEVTFNRCPFCLECIGV